jgi:hypothetical protein
MSKTFKRVGFMMKFWENIKVIFSGYNLEPKIYISDQLRNKNDLIKDISQKRVLLFKLNKKIKNSIFLISFLCLLFIGYISINNLLIPEKKVFNQYIEDYSIRLDKLNNSGTKDAIENTEILIALSFIQEGDYKSASLLLSNMEGEEAEWLRALCYIRLKNNLAAKASLRKIVESKGKYSLSAKEILDKY